MLCSLTRHAFVSVKKFNVEDARIKSVDATCSPVNERFKSNDERNKVEPQKESSKTFSGDAVVLATGHSARDIYYELHESGVELEPKGFAVGFRIEHPQVSVMNGSFLTKNDL